LNKRDPMRGSAFDGERSRREEKGRGERTGQKRGASRKSRVVVVGVRRNKMYSSRHKYKTAEVGMGYKDVGFNLNKGFV